MCKNGINTKCLSGKMYGQPSVAFAKENPLSNQQLSYDILLAISRTARANTANKKKVLVTEFNLKHSHSPL